MARGVKKEKAKAMLTPEEKLAAALVPVEEQPYRVPGNWCWVKLLEAFINQTDSKKKVQQKTYLEQGDIAVVDQGQELIGGYTNDRSMLYTGSLPVIVFGDHTRCIKYINFPFAQGADGIKVLQPKQYLQPIYFYFALQSIDIPNMGYRRHYPLFKTFFMPVAPFQEQKRIADRIESLFAKLDEAKEKAQAVVDGFEDRKAAILHRAFKGELTKSWRENRGVLFSEWRQMRFDDCIISMQNGIAKRTGTIGTPYVVLRLANLSDDAFNTDDLRVIVLDEKEQTNYALHTDDVLMVRVNGSKDNVGKQYRITNQRNWAFCDHIIRIRYSNSIVPQYMVYFSKSEEYRQYVQDNMVSSAGQNTISRKGMAKLTIPVPEKPEQEQIVIILGRMFKREQQAKEAAEQVLSQIDTMKKAILARAFRGELGTNDPTDESAEELLKRIL